MRYLNLSLCYKIFRLELKNSIRQFYIFSLCLGMGVLLFSLINIVASTISSSFAREALAILGGDIEVKTKGLEPDKKAIDVLNQYGRISHVTTLRAMLDTKQQQILVEIKAIDDAYPLLGRLELANQDEIPKARTELIDNNIAVDPALLDEHGLNIGDKVSINSYEFVINSIIKHEPDKAIQIFNFGPKIIMQQSALKASKIIDSSSLAEQRYRILVNDPKLNNEILAKQIKEKLLQEFPQYSWQISTSADAGSAIQKTINQLLAFMNLAAIAILLIAGVSIFASLQEYLNKRSVVIAILKIQGATTATIISSYLFLLIFIALTCGGAGAVLGGFLAFLSLPFLSKFLPIISFVPQDFIYASLLSVWYGLLVTLLFSMRIILTYCHSSAASVFQGQGSSLSKSKTIFPVIAIVLLLAFTFIYSSNDKIFNLAALAIIAITLILFKSLHKLLAQLARYYSRVPGFFSMPPYLKLAVGNFYRPGQASSAVIFTLGISLTFMVTLFLVEANFNRHINKIINEQAPDFFIIDIPKYEKDKFAKLLQEYAVPENIMLYPMMRGQITKIAGKDVTKVNVSEDIAWVLKGDRGISFSATPPKNAKIVQGKWWSEDYQGEPLLSVDARFLKGMGLKIGDNITVKILGEEITASIASAREIDYSTMQMNFAMMFSPGVIEEFPISYLATIKLDNSQLLQNLTRNISQEFPGVTIIKTKEIVTMLQNIMHYVIWALKIILVFAVMSSILVLISALASALEQRSYGITVLKLLGLERLQIVKSCLFEWGLIAIATSMIAAFVGGICAYLISVKLRNQEFVLLPGLILSIMAFCLILTLLVGYLKGRNLFSKNSTIGLKT